MESYPWYCLATGEMPITQGDIIEECQILKPEEDVERGQITATVQVYDAIVMSQACDLQHGKLEIVLVCPVFSLENAQKNVERLRGKKGKEKLRRGEEPALHLLNMSDIETLQRDFLVVDFRSTFGVPFESLKRMAEERDRLRLLPPYREHLSQAFARFIMRVGLPTDIPSFT